MKNRVMIIILFLTLIIAIKVDKVDAKNAEIGTPKNLVVWCKNSHTLKLNWSKVNNVSGYKVYRYQKSQKKYKMLKRIGAQNTRFTDKKLKKHRIYKYKIVAFRNGKAGKKYGKKTYCVTARTYGKKAKIVNVAKGKSVKVYKQNDNKEIGICTSDQLYVDLIADGRSKSLKTKLVSDKVKWSSDNPSILSVNKKGKIVSGEKSGKVTISARAHNGTIGKIKINIINYARPDSFPLYHGGIKEINKLLMDYKKEISDIAEFFTINDAEDRYGDITVNNKGIIIGIPNIKNIAVIENTIKKLLEEYPYPIDIYYEKGCVVFTIGDNVTVEYDANNSFDDNAHKITSHWIAMKTI